MIKIAMLGLGLTVGAIASASAAMTPMSPETYAGPLGPRVSAQAHCVWTNLDQQHLNMPSWIPGNWLRGGSYINPTSCQRVD